MLPQLPLECSLIGALGLRAAELGSLVSLHMRLKVVLQGTRDRAALDRAVEDWLGVAQHVSPQVVLPLESASAAILGAQEWALQRQGTQGW